ncbi:hypothetical protein CsSME_00050004 [Camellia sinensis var. sinensis]
MEQNQAQQRLKEAAEEGDINGLYSCIKEDPHILDGIDDIPFVDSPLHTAASVGHTHFALEMMNLKPSFTKKLNPEGLTPLDLALRNGYLITVRRLVNFDKQLIRVKGREMLTPLHHVAEKGHIDLLAEFLCACPESIMDLTIRDETAVHIAVKNFQLQAFKVLLGWLRRTQRLHVLNRDDDEGNSVLHIAVSTLQPQIVKLLVKESYTKKNKNAKNLEGLTARDMAARLDPSAAKTQIEKILRQAGALKSPSLAGSSDSSLSTKRYSRADFLMSPERWLEKAVKMHQSGKLTMEMRNVILVVAVLVAVCTFQAILNPPGGVIRNNNNQLTNNITCINATNSPTNTTDNPVYNSISGGLVTYGHLFSKFYYYNTICFFLSIATIMAVLPSRLSSVLLFCSLSFLIISYGYSFDLISPSPSPSYFDPTSFLLVLLVQSSQSVLLLVLLVRSRLIWRVLKCICMSPLRLRRKRLKMLQLCLDGVHPKKSD